MCAKMGLIKIRKFNQMKFLLGLLLVAFSVVTAPAALIWRWNATPTDIPASNDTHYAMSMAVAMFNTYSDDNYDIGVINSPGTPTADAGYHGQPKHRHVVHRCEHQRAAKFHHAGERLDVIGGRRAEPDLACGSHWLAVAGADEFILSGTRHKLV